MISDGTLLIAMVNATRFCFPLLMVVTVVVYLARKPIAALLDRNERAKAVRGRIIEAGPKEGWSGYVILAAVCIWLAVMAGLILVSIDAGDPKKSSHLGRSDAALVEQGDAEPQTSS